MSYIPKKYKIVNMKQLAPEIHLMKIKADIPYEPGEFIQVSALGIGEAPFSICSHKKNYIEILIRTVGNTTKALTKLNKNDHVFIRGPYGQGYPMQKFKDKNIALIGGGTGIAPLISVLEYIETNRKDYKNINLYFGFKNQKYILFKHNIKKWQNKCNINISVDQGTKTCPYFIGHIPDLLEKDILSPKNTVALICGPPIMIKTVIKKLKKLGFQSSQIYLSLERRMECGVGRCGRCMIHGQYVCKDGPVFSYEELENLKND